MPNFNTTKPGDVNLLEEQRSLLN